MAQPAFLGLSPALQMPILTGHLALGGGAERDVEDFFLPFGKAANFPVEEPRAVVLHADGPLGAGRAQRRQCALARDTYRPDLYRAALKPLGVALPGANAKVEGALTAATPVGSAGASLVLGPDGFFDGRIFDPDRIDDYLAVRDWAMPTG